MSELDLMRERESKKEGGGSSSFLSLKDRASHSLLSEPPQAEEESTGSVYLSLSLAYSIHLTRARIPHSPSR